MSAQTVESLNDIDNKVLQFFQPLHYGLRFRATELTKRYCGNNLSVALEFALEINGKTSRYSALIANESVKNLSGKFNSCCHDNDDEFSVLVGNVEVMNDEKQRVDRISAVVWLKPFDEIANGGFSDALYFSFITGKKLFLRWPRLKDGELDPPPIRLPITGFGEQPNKVIEARSEVMNNFPGKHSEARRDRAASMILDCLRNRLVVLIADEWISAFLKEPTDFGLKVTDVLVGPL